LGPPDSQMRITDLRLASLRTAPLARNRSRSGSDRPAIPARPVCTNQRREPTRIKSEVGGIITPSRGQRDVPCNTACERRFLERSQKRAEGVELDGFDQMIHESRFGGEFALAVLPVTADGHEDRPLRSTTPEP